MVEVQHHLRGETVPASGGAASQFLTLVVVVDEDPDPLSNGRREDLLKNAS